MWRNLNQIPPHRVSRRSFAILAQDLSASAPATLFPLRYAELIALLMQPTLTAHPPTPLGHSPPYAAMDTGVLKNCLQLGLVSEGYGGGRAEQWLVSLL